MKVLPMHQNFRMFTKGTDLAGAYDIYMPERGFATECTPSVIPLGFGAEVPAGHVALLLPRSGVGFNHGLELNNTCGVIDHDYKGEWKASLLTKSYRGYQWEQHDRVLQFLLVPVLSVEFELVKSLGVSNRGSGGFGSSGQ